MKHLLRTTALALSFTAGFATSVLAVETVTPTPMISDNMPSPGTYQYSEGTCVPMPLITWGADIATIHANGDVANTASGSIFDTLGVDLCLNREDNFRDQVRAYLRGDTPFLRGTADMIVSAGEVLCQDASTCPEIFYNLSRSAGGDILLGNNDRGVTDLNSLRGKTIGLQLDGPHMNLLVETLALANMTQDDVNIVWFEDLGFDGANSAAHAFQAGEVDAAFVIFPDMLELTEGDGQVAGTENIFSTLSLDRVIYDVVAVNPVFADANPDFMANLTSGLLRGNESLAAIVRDGGDPSVDTHADRSAAYRRAAATGAELLFDTTGDAVFESTVMEMYAFDLQMQGWTGNVQFLTDPGENRGVVWYGSIASSATAAFNQMGLMQSSAVPALTSYAHDWTSLQTGLNENFGVQAPVINQEAAARVIEQLGAQGVEDSKIVDFEVFFEPNQAVFSAELYSAQFDRVLEIMSRAGGAVVVIEGHAAPTRYLATKYGRRETPATAWTQMAQGLRNESLRRAETVEAELQAYATAQGYNFSFENVTTVGNGITDPAVGMCTWQLRYGSNAGAQVPDPCGPNGWSYMGPNSSAAQPAGEAWGELDAGERRVVFTLVNIEGEATAFADDQF